jgi:hypothetical protein
MTEAERHEPIGTHGSVPLGLIGMCEDNLYDGKVFREIVDNDPGTFEEKGAFTEEQMRYAQRYTTEEIIQKIEKEEPGIAQYVRWRTKEATTPEDAYLIASSIYSVVDAIKTFQSPEYYYNAKL